MLDWCRKTLSRYKKGLVTSGVVTSSVVAMGYACKRKLASWQQEHMELLLRNSHLEQHYLQHYHNMATTLNGYFEKLNQRISTLCDTEQTLRNLKDGSVSKVDGWELLRRQVLTKLLLSLYSSTLLCLFLSVQLTVVKAKILQSMSSGGDSVSVNATTKSYLSKITLLLEHSVPEILNICEGEVDRVFREFKLDSLVNFGDLRVLLDNVSVRQEMDLLNLCRVDLGNDIMDSQLKEVILVTLDVLESQDYSNTYHSCVAHAQDFYCKQLSKIVQQDSVILAKLLSPLNKIPVRILSTEKEEFISHILDCGVLKVLCCNLYEGLTAT
ncbi:hypothetical protein ACHWQZ_G011657 [Mnemiopsis leidyi]